MPQIWNPIAQQSASVNFTSVSVGNNQQISLEPTNTFLSGSFTGSFTGSFSGAITSASYAQTASYLNGFIASASYASTASYVKDSISSSFALTASYVLNAPNANTFPYTGSAIVTGSLVVSSSTVFNTVNITPTTPFISLVSKTGQNGLSVWDNGSVLIGVNATGNLAGTAQYGLYVDPGYTAGLYAGQVDTMRVIATGAYGGRIRLNPSNIPAYMDFQYSNFGANIFLDQTNGYLTLQGGRYADQYYGLYFGNLVTGLGMTMFGSSLNVSIGNSTIDSGYKLDVSGSMRVQGNATITGSLTVSGSSTFTNIGPAIFSGSVTSTGGFTGSLFGTASYAISASYAPSSVSASYTVSSSYSNNSTSASYALTASYISGSIKSVGVSMPSAFTVTNSPLTSNGTIAITGAGIASQYIKGDGTLASFPNVAGGGGGTVYYLNGNTSQGSIGGTTMYQLSLNAQSSASANFTSSTTGSIASFITDVNQPNQLTIPSGIWVFETYLSQTGSGSSIPTIQAVVEKWNGSTITVIAIGAIEQITNGSVKDLYQFAVSIPTGVTLAATDRIVIQIQIVDAASKTITLYTENSNISSVTTTFANGIASLNGLSTSTQYFGVGTNGNDFNISSSANIHTFNLPSASATNRGALSSTDWTIFNNKQTALSGTGFVKISGTTISYDNSTYLTGNQTITLSGDITGSGTTAITTTIGALKVTNGMLAGSIDYAKMNAATVPTWNQNTSGTATNITATSNSTLTTLSALSLPYSQLTGAPSLAGYVTSVTGTSPIASSGGTMPVISISQATNSTSGYLSSTDWNTFNNKQATLSGTGFVKISGTTISYDNSTYLTGNQTITLSGDITGSGTTAITTTIGALKVTNGMLAGSINYSKMDATTVPTWNQDTTGTAQYATYWGGFQADFNAATTTFDYIAVRDSAAGKLKLGSPASIATFLSGQTMNIAGNANTATSTTLLNALGNYVWSASTLPTSFNQGIQSSFVQGSDGWQSYGSVMTMRTYSGGGGSLQLYVPYSPTYGGIGLQVRLGNYDISSGNSWTSWKTLLASDNYNSYAPTLTGTGASGTWGIAITGNSGTTTLAANSTLWSGLNINTTTGTYTATGILGTDGTSTIKTLNAASLQTFLGLGSAAYLNASVSPTANTVVQRDANGYMQAVYYYSSNAGRQTSGINSLTGKLDAGAGYMYEFTAGAVQTFLGLGSMAYASTSTYYTTSASDGRYAYIGGSNATGTWGISISGNAATAYNWANTPDTWYGIGQSTSASGATAIGGYYPWTLNYHTGLAFSAHSAYGGLRFYNQNYPTGPLASTPVLQIINFGLQVNGEIAMNSNNISGVATITATTFSGALSGNASTATLAANSTLWNGYAINLATYGTNAGDFLNYDNSAGIIKPFSTAQIQTKLGLGSYAYRSSGLAELSGATFTGTIIAGATTGNIRLTGDGGSGNDGFVGAAGDGTLYFRNWSGTRGFTINSSNQLVHSGAISASNLSGTNTGDQTNISGNAATATYATTSGTSTFVASPDGTRNPSTNSLPNSNPRTVRFDFATAGTVTGATGNYAGVMTYTPWDGTTASTGDSSYQLAFCNYTGINASGLPGLAIRQGIDSTWNSTWYQVLHSGNYTNYTGAYLPLAGGTMSGAVNFGNYSIAGLAQISHANGRIMLSGNLHIDAFNGYNIYLQYYNQGGTIQSYASIAMNGYNISGAATITATTFSGTSATFSSSVTTGSPLSIKALNPYIQWLNAAGDRQAYIQHATNLVYNTDVGIHVFNQQISGTSATFSGGVQLTSNGSSVSTTYAGITTMYQFVDGSGGVLKVDGDNQIRIVTNNVDRFHISSAGAVFSGNVSINGTVIGTDQTFGNPYRTFAFGNNSNSYNRIFGATDATDGIYINAATGQGVNFRVNGGGANVVSIPSTGNVLIGATSDNGSKLQVKGSVRFNYTNDYGYFGIGYNSGIDYGFFNYNYGRNDLLFTQSTGAATFSSLITANGLANTGNTNANALALPAGGSYYSGASTNTGAIAITLPRAMTNAMIRMTIKIYQYSTGNSFEVNCGGYTYPDGNTWANNPFAYIVAQPGYSQNWNVRFGYTSGGKAVIYIGETSSTWSYLGIHVTDVQVSYADTTMSAWNSGWTIGFATSLENVTATQSNTQVGMFLDGFARNQTSGANTIVQRDANGYIQNSYFYTSGGGSERQNSAMGYFAGFNTSDYYIRSYTAAAVATLLSGQSMNIVGNASTATNLSTGRTNWSTNGTISAVVGQLAWKNYNNNHTIFDASNSTAPDGTSISNTNPSVAWSATYPTLMGWNGTSTYGVRVDSARIADSATSAGTVTDGMYLSATQYVTGVKYFQTTNGGYLGSLSNGTLQVFSTSNNSAYMSFHKGSYYAVNMGLDTDNTFRIGGWSAPANVLQLDMSGNLTVNGSIRATTNFYADQNYGYGLVGLYSSYRFQGVFAMGDAYKVAYDGTTPGNLYGLAWSHPNAGGQAANLSSHGLLVMINGTTYAAISTNIWTAGQFNGSGAGLTGTASSLTAGNVTINYNNNSNSNYQVLWGSGNGVFGTAEIYVNPYYDSLNIGGNFYAGGNVTAYSDARLKDNIELIPHAIEKVQAIRGVTFTRNDAKEEDRNKRHTGIIAQELLEVLPEAVSLDHKGIYSVAYGNIVGLLIEAIKEQQTQIEELRNLINNK